MTFLQSRLVRQGAASWLVLTIDRPERGNALGTTIARELSAALAELPTKHAGIRALVLRATPVVKGSRRTWIAGGDLKELAQLGTRSEAEAYAKMLNAFCRQLDALPIPVIVAVDGAAIGGGAELALAGDLRLATEASSWEFKQLKVGLAAGYGTTRRLVELVGLARAQDLLFRCLRLDAAEALALGLVSQVLPDEAALDAAIAALCSELAELAPEALAAQKRMLKGAVSLHPGAAAGAELDAFGAIWRNPAHAKFLDSFSARRES